MTKFYQLGRFDSPHGLKGELNLRRYYPAADFSKIHKLYVEEKPYTIKSFRDHKKNVLIFLAGISTISQAETLRGKDVFIDEQTAQKLKCLFNEDLLHKEVCTPKQVTLGRVKEILETPAHKILVVQSKGKELLIPCIEPYILEIGAKLIVQIDNLKEG